MYFKLGKGIAWLLTVLLFSITGKVFAQQKTPIVTLTSDIAFTAKPANCVALHQGRKCYATVSLSWQTSQAGNYCLYQKAGNKMMKCWVNSRESQFKFEFESSGKLEYQLIAIKQNKVLAETFIDVSWVHKASPRKRRWRLF